MTDETTETPVEPELVEPEPAQPDAEPAEPAEPIEGDDADAPAETPGEQTETPAEPEPPVQAVAMDEKAIEKAHKEAERLRKDVAGRVGRIFGEDVVHMVECPLCSETAPGWIWNPQSVELQDDHLARVLLALGVVGPKKLRHHPTIETCPTCGGEGQLETGSKVPGMNVIDCETCGKKGWVDSRQAASVFPIAPAVSETNGLTGPLHYQEPAPADQFEDDPAVQSLKSRGFLVVPPPDLGVRVS